MGRKNAIHNGTSMQGNWKNYWKAITIDEVSFRKILSCYKNP